MKSRLFPFILFILGLCHLSSTAQNNRLFTIQNGMQTCDIQSIMLDHRGLLWISGSSPIGYFSGSSFSYMNNHDPQTGKLLYNIARQIVDDNNDCYWVVSDGGLYYFDSSSQQYTFVPLSPEENKDNRHPMRQMINFDAKGKIKLVTTEGFGFFLLDNETHTVLQPQTSDLQRLVQESFVTDALIDSRGYLWVARITRTLSRFDCKRNRATDINITPEAQEMLYNYQINKMIEVPNRNALYISTSGGIMKYDYKSNTLAPITGKKSIPYTSFLINKENVLMVGSDSHGLWTIDLNDKVQPYELTDPYYDLSMAKVVDIAMDRQGNIILGLLQKGIYVIPHQSKEFDYYPISLKANGRNTSCITSIHLSGDKYWIGTDGAGVFYANKDSLNAAKPFSKGLRTLQVQDLEVDRHGTLWVGTYGGGLQCCPEGGKEFYTPDWVTLFPNSAVMGICYDKERDILYANTNGTGVIKLDLTNKTSEYYRYDESQNPWTVDIKIDEEGTLWIVEVDDIFYINEKKGKKGIVSRNILPGKPICLECTGKGKYANVLIGTQNGLLIYNPTTGEALPLLEGKKISSINDTPQEYWVASPSSLYIINKSTLHINELHNFGGIFLGEFHKRSSLQTPDGELLWGCDNGILMSKPRILHQTQKHHNKVILTSMIHNGHFVSHLTNPEIIEANILNAKSITLPYNESTFTLSCAIPDFCATSDLTYEYQLEGFEDEWNSTEYGRIHYNSLPYGDYVLHVRARFNEKSDPSTEHTINIHISTPWYFSWWASFIYIIIGVVMFIIIIYTHKLRLERKQELQSAYHKDQINEAKLKLFTSITHELRSPLTMIITPVQHLLESTKDEQLRKNLNIMLQNCNRLLNIVRQITDIRKIDSGQFRLHFEEVDICQYTQEITRSFMGAAMVKKISISVENSEHQIYAWIDPVHFEKIIMNILSNAFKFTPEGGQILLRNRMKRDELEISVYNEGPHIPEEESNKLFERFYQTESGSQHLGSGIGLNLCYELVQLHHGTITMRNVEPTGVEFSVHIPLGYTHLTAEEMSPRPQEAPSEISMNNLVSAMTGLQGPTGETDTCSTTDNYATLPEEDDPKSPSSILIVDDDPGICEFLAEQLSEDFHNVLVAHGGNPAWNIVLQNRPDIVISDIMMPDGSGIELAQKIKSNPQLDNIPIIMVTGEDDDTLQLKSLQLSVDHFLQKPFNMSILKATISQALKVRENTRKHTKRTNFGYTSEQIDMDSQNESLYNRINRILQEHLDDSEYNVKDLSEEIGISRVHLNRKMKEHYGLSPNAFIRAYRLKQAAHLLTRNDANVSEVAYKVGFSTHSHFTSSFRDFFGMSPKEFVSYYRREENQEALKKLLE